MAYVDQLGRWYVVCTACCHMALLFAIIFCGFCGFFFLFFNLVSINGMVDGIIMS